MRMVGIVFGMLFLMVAIAGAVDFTGTYVYKTPKATITLSLSQNQKGNITGLLSSTTGAKFQIVGKLQEDTAVGNCIVREKRAAPFEAHFEDQYLLFTLINKKKNTIIKFPVPVQKKPEHSASAEKNKNKTPSQSRNGQGVLQFGPKPHSPTPGLTPKSTPKQKAQHSLIGNWICRTSNGDILLNFLSQNRLTFNGSPANYSATTDG